MSESSSNPKKRNWLLILGVITTILTAGGVIATLITVPEFRCSLLRWSCPPEPIVLAEVQVYTQTESGENLEGVKVTVIGSNGVETTQTDSNGYAKVAITNKGDVNVNLSKLEYPTQNFTINLQNEQSRVRTIRLSKSGNNPQVISTAPTPSPAITPSITPTPTTDPATAIPAPASLVPNLAVQNQFMKMELTGRSRDNNGKLRLAFVIKNLTADDLYLALSANSVIITDNFGQVCGSRNLNGLLYVYSSANKPDHFTKISPDSTISVGDFGCEFPTSTQFNASFSLVRYQPSTINPEGDQTKFSVGFNLIKLENKK